MTTKALKIKALEYFYAGNFKDLEDVMTSLAQKSPKAHAKLRDEMAAHIAESNELDEIGGLEW